MCACAATPAEAVTIKTFKPDAIAIEPPALIGGKISVAVAKPHVITATTSRIRTIPVLCGAGIRSTNDVRIARELGSRGILVASNITTSKNPAQSLQQLVDGLR